MYIDSFSDWYYAPTWRPYFTYWVVTRNTIEFYGLQRIFRFSKGQLFMTHSITSIRSSNRLVLYWLFGYRFLMTTRQCYMTYLDVYIWTCTYIHTDTYHTHIYTFVGIKTLTLFILIPLFCFTQYTGLSHFCCIRVYSLPLSSIRFIRLTK